MGYGIVTMRITGGQNVKIQTTGGYIELEANHRLVMCNYPFSFFEFINILCDILVFKKLMWSMLHQQFIKYL